MELGDREAQRCGNPSDSEGAWLANRKTRQDKTRQDKTGQDVHAYYVGNMGWEADCLMITPQEVI
jgi:hypothetical protein